MNHGMWKTLRSNYDTALEKLPAALSAEGFGIITQIDLKETFKNKLGVDFKRYKILGACNPSLAHKAVSTDERVGVLLPCNVVLYEGAEGGAVLGAIDPMQTLGNTASAEFKALGDQVQAKLRRVLDAIE